MTKEYILDFLSTRKQLLKTKFSVTKFGSYATNTANKDSDIDLAIETTTKDFFLRDHFYPQSKYPFFALSTSP